MSSLNKVLLIGNLGRDPETRYLPNGDCVTNFSIATTDKWIDKQSGEKNEKTEWHNVTAYRKLGETCGKYLKKGSSIYCEGKLQTSKYTDKDGVEKPQTKIIIDSMQMLGSRSTDQDSNQEQRIKPQQKKQTITNELNDDIPF